MNSRYLPVPYKFDVIRSQINKQIFKFFSLKNLDPDPKGQRKRIRIRNSWLLRTLCLDRSMPNLLWKPPLSRQVNYSYNDDEVVIIEDSDAEETYLSQVQ